jgi:hypothetical protein
MVTEFPKMLSIGNLVEVAHRGALLSPTLMPHHTPLFDPGFSISPDSAVQPIESRQDNCQ